MQLANEIHCLILNVIFGHGLKLRMELIGWTEMLFSSFYQEICSIVEILFSAFNQENCQRVFSKYLRFRLSSSLNGWMAIQ